MSFSNKDTVIGRALFVEQAYDYDKTEVAAALLHTFGFAQHDWLIDVGANIGTVCLPYVRNGVFRSALAIEPEPQNFAHLESNIEANGCVGVVHARRVALSASPGRMLLKLSTDNFGDHRIVAASPSSAKSIVVEVVTLDGLLAAEGIHPSDLGLVWIDVQGHEMSVLYGGENCLRAGVPFVLEFWPHGIAAAGHTVEDFLRYLQLWFVAFVDLADLPESRPASDLPRLADRYTGYAYSDLLLLPRS